MSQNLSHLITSKSQPLKPNLVKLHPQGLYCKWVKCNFLYFLSFINADVRGTARDDIALNLFSDVV